MLSLGIQVQTLDTDGVVQSNVTGDCYTNLFDIEDGDPLPGALDISELVDWDQIGANIASLTNSGEQDIEEQLPSWIRVSYEVWSLTLTNLKSRSLERVSASSHHYYTGNSGFAYGGSTSSASGQLLNEAETLAETDFSAYDFSDDANFGTVILCLKNPEKQCLLLSFQNHTNYTFIKRTYELLMAVIFFLTFQKIEYLLVDLSL